MTISIKATNIPNIDRDGRGIKGSIDVVDGDWVVWIGSVTADIDNDGELAGSSCFLDLLVRHKVWNLRREIDAIDKDVHYKKQPSISKSFENASSGLTIQDLGERSTLGRLC